MGGKLRCGVYCVLLCNVYNKSIVKYLNNIRYSQLSIKRVFTKIHSHFVLCILCEVRCPLQLQRTNLGRCVEPQRCLSTYFAILAAELASHSIAEEGYR